MKRGNESVGNPVHAADLDERHCGQGVACSWPFVTAWSGLSICLQNTSAYKANIFPEVVFGKPFKREVNIQLLLVLSTAAFFSLSMEYECFFGGGSCVCFPTFAVFSAKNCHVFRCFNPSGPCSSVIRGSAHAKKKTAGREVHHSILKS